MNKIFKLIFSFLLLVNFVNRIQTVPRNIKTPAIKPVVAKPVLNQSKKVTPHAATKPQIASGTGVKPIVNPSVTTQTIPVSNQQAQANPITTTRQAPFPDQYKYPVQKPPVGSSNRPFNQQAQPTTPAISNYTNPSGVIVVPVYVPVLTTSNSQENIYNSNSQMHEAYIPSSDKTTTIKLCPSMPANTDSLSDDDYQKVMSQFRQDNFNLDVVNTQKQADKCEDQCPTEFPGKCYTGFTSDDNKCECAITKN